MGCSGVDGTLNGWGVQGVAVADGAELCDVEDFDERPACNEWARDCGCCNCRGAIQDLASGEVLLMLASFQLASLVEIISK